MIDEQLIFRASLAATFIAVMALIVYGFTLLISADGAIKDCYLHSHLRYDGKKLTAVMGRVHFRPDIQIGLFEEYEKAEEAMARYASCRVKP